MSHFKGSVHRPLSSFWYCESRHFAWSLAGNVWHSRLGTGLNSFIFRAEYRLCWKPIRLVSYIPWCSTKSVLGFLFLILYTADGIAIAQRHGFNVHTYAGDTQRYFHEKAVSCESQITVHFRNEHWMSAIRLMMNSNKTDFIWLGSRQQL